MPQTPSRTLPPSSSRSHTELSLNILLDGLFQGITPQQGLRLAVKKALGLLEAEGAVFQIVNGAFSLVHAPESVPKWLGKALETTLLTTSPGPAEMTFAHDDMEVLAFTQNLRQGQRIILAFWRKKSWPARNRTVLALFWRTMTLLLNLESLYHTALQRTGHDPGTGLLTWDGIQEEITRRLMHLDQNGLAGTLAIVEINGLQDIAHEHGPEVEENSLLYCLRSLRRAIRPTDLVGRLGSGLFTLWLDGADRFAAAERAEYMTQKGIPLPFLYNTILPLQIGLSCREPGSRETTDSLLEHAILALRTTKIDGKAWHFAHHHA